MEPLEGTVTAFDDDAGLGVITATDGTAYPFHCTQIADGIADDRASAST